MNWLIVRMGSSFLIVGDFLSNILESMWATEESCETCSVRLDSVWLPRVTLAVADDEDQSLGEQSDRRGQRQHRNRLVYPLVARSHRQHNAKLYVATHHASICFGSLFQRIGFDHGAYPAQFRKAKRVIRIRRRYPCPSFNSLAAPDELNRSHLNRIGGYADQDKPAVRTQTANHFGHCLGIRRCRDNDSCAA